MAEKSKAVIAVAGAGLVGAFAGFSISPEQGFALLKWLNESLGPVGLVAIITLGSGLAVAVTGNWLMWTRLKEKDAECQTEMAEAETRWQSRFLEMRSDVKEAFGIVAKLSEQVTLLAERAKPTPTPTRVRGH